LKLLLASADHRLMVFGASNKLSAEKGIRELIHELGHCALTRYGDRYLFAGLVENDGSCLFQLHKARRRSIRSQ